MTQAVSHHWPWLAQVTNLSNIQRMYKLLISATVCRLGQFLVFSTLSRKIQFKLLSYLAYVTSHMCIFNF